MDGEEVTKIPFGAFDSELKGWEYTIPEGMEAVIKNGKIIVREKESEDEKIRKEISKFLKDIHNDSLEGRRFIADRYGDAIPDNMIPTWLAWLEKQGSQNLANSAKTCKNEPKFKVGDCIADTYCKGKVIELTDDSYLLDTGQGIPFSCEDNVYLWTIQDAKDGDVLATQGSVFIFKHLDKTGRSLCKSYCEVIGNSGLGLGFEFSTNDVYPATKEQRGLLFQKMKEAGYEWNAEKKELKKIEQNPAWSEEDDVRFTSTMQVLRFASSLDSFNQYGKKDIRDNLTWLESLKSRVQPQSMSEWSEDDEVGFHDALWAMEQARTIAKDENDMGNLWYAEKWLKSLRDRIQLHPKQEWSEEDERSIRDSIFYLESAKKYFEKDDNILWDEKWFNSCVDWLKALKERYTWKPSKEQMENLGRAVNGGTYRTSLLMELYQDLKKLKGE